MKPNLSTHYLGLPLANPLVASASPLTGNLESLQQLEQSGASAAVLPSLFEEQVEHEMTQVFDLQELQADSHAESLSYFPSLDQYNTGPDQYQQLIRDAKAKVRIPIIASLNGSTADGWTHYAHLIEQAGADALELNVYVIPTDRTKLAADVEQHYCDLVSSVRQKVSLPLSVKIGPYFSSLPNLTDQLVAAGADGLVLFNRFLAPDVDLRTLKFAPAIELSTPEELRLSLRWIAILRDECTASLAATGGVHSASDVVKSLLVGADIVMIASTLLKLGPEHLWSMCLELCEWLAEHDYESIDQLKGSMSMKNCADPESLKGANYMKALTSFSNERF